MEMQNRHKKTLRFLKAHAFKQGRGAEQMQVVWKPDYLRCEESLDSQEFGDVRFQLSGCGGRGIAFVHFAISSDEKFREIPFDALGT